MTMISPTEAGARFTGVLALVALGFLFLINFSRVAGEGAWGMALVFAALITASLLVSLALVRSDSHIVRTPWLHAIGIASLMLAIHFLSRTSGLPGMAELEGRFFTFFGLLEVFAAFGLISTAAYAMRELTLEGVPHRRAARGSMGVPGGPAAGYYSLVVAVVLMVPSVASAAGKNGKAADAKGGDAAGGAGSAGATDAEALLGGTELSIAFVLCLAFVTWAAHTLRERSALPAAGY